MSEGRKDTNGYTLENTEYENKIDDLIGSFGNEQLCNSIRQIVNDCYSSSVSWEYHFHNPDLISTYTHLKDSVVLISASKLIAILKNQVSSLEDQYDRDKAEILFKHLSSLYGGSGPHTPADIEDKVLKIREGAYFPKPDSSIKKTGKGDGKYRALMNLFKEKPKASSEDTIRFGIALLGIKLGPLEELLIELQKEGEEEKKASLNNSTSTPLTPSPPDPKPFLGKRTLLAIGTVALLVICVIYFALENQRPPEPVFSFDIPSHKLFKTEMKMSEDVATRDCVTLVTYDPEFKDMVVSADTIPLNKLWIKFRVANYSNKTYFPDAIYLRKMQSNSLQGEIIRRNRTIFDSTSLVFKIFETEKTISNSIQTTSLFPSIAAKSYASGSVVISFDSDHPERINEFKMGLSMSGGPIQEVESIESIKVGISN